MRLLLVGSNSKWAIENHFVEHLSKLCELKFYNAHGIFIDFHRKSILNKLTIKLNLSTIYNQINLGLLEEVSIIRPDVILVFKGMEIFPSTLTQIKKKGIYLVNYNPDHPFEFFGSGSGNNNVLNSIKLFDHHFSYSKTIIKSLKNKFNKEASWLPFGYSLAMENNIEMNENKLCFIGNPDKQRAVTINYLLQNNIPVDVYGNNWQKFLTPSENCVIKEAIYEEEFIRVSQKYKAQLNTFRPHNHGSHNMRTFEMPALGNITISPYSEEHKFFFKENSEAFFYKNNVELLRQSKSILDLNEEECKEIRLNAYHRSILSNYSYSDRANELFNFISTI